MDYVFGYGSLVALPTRALTREISESGFAADLMGFRRFWGVAMDNRHVEPGYKNYFDPGSLELAEVFVSFLDITRSDGSSVNGVCLPVDERQLAGLDGRERNYVRLEVTEHLSSPPGRVWAYAGSPDGRMRRAEADRLGRCCVHASYVSEVAAAFDRLSPSEGDRYRETTDHPACPVRELERVDGAAANQSVRVAPVGSV